MSWLWSSSPIDELVDRATSENLPAGSEDLALNLEICDQIRSKQVSPKDAVKALKRRISHKNPNVQLLALGLTDVCVKNGGHHFLVEIAYREFIDNLTSIMKAPSGCNLDVKNKILSLIQTWGILFRGKHGLGYVCDVYMILQHEGFQFPSADSIGTALVESEAEVRVCDVCWMKKRLGPKSVVALESHGLGGGLEYVNKPSSVTSSAINGTKSSTTSSSAAKPTSPSSEDEDLRRAIELSLKEANSQPGYSGLKRSNTEPAKKSQSQSQPPSQGPASQEEEDDDLKAAIEASLRESGMQSSSSSAPGPRSIHRQTSYSAYTYSKKPVSAVATAPSTNELSDTEKSNIEMFSVLVDRMQLMQGDVTGNREIQALYEQISKLQMKLALSIEETSRKQQEFVSFNDKIDHAVKIYDHHLQERLNSSYQRRLNMSNYNHPGGLSQPNTHSYYGSGIPAPGTPQTPQHSHIYPQTSNADSRYQQYIPSVAHAPQPTGVGAPYSSAPPPQTPQITYQQAPYQQPQQTSQPQYPYQQPNQQPAAQAPVAPYNVTSPTVPNQQVYANGAQAPGQQPQPQPSPAQGQYVYQNTPTQQPSSQPPQQQGYAPQPQQQQHQQPMPQDMNGQSLQQQPVVQSPPPQQPLQQPIQNAFVQQPPQQQQQQQQLAQGQQMYPASSPQPQQPQPQQMMPVQYAPQQQQQQQQQQPVYSMAPPQPKVEEAPLIEL
ncbi:Vacuolar protein-sorting-associated protein 27 [Lunasporangiospora selenospora]|uniref:Vacuolar protein-sorting-associated protein 27 n=1 Tax=Lunasporangiospora selenospora TaxID=979761 RepID=A0A9P6G3Z4_9FUNG|nr:Vacuolar protein-sorting-associated protein 27 [Lunasporangiospora selenospora]